MRKSSRKGLSLIEILVAVAIVGGPMIYLMSGVISSTRSTGKHLDRATATILLTDVAEWMMGKSHVRPSMAARRAARELKWRWMDAREALGVPDTAQQFERQLDELISKLVVQVERAPGGKQGLCRVTLSLALSDRTRLTVPVLLRGIPKWRKKKGGNKGGGGDQA